jgi:hypothetical protein
MHIDGLRKRQPRHGVLRDRTNSPVEVETTPLENTMHRRSILQPRQEVNYDEEEEKLFTSVTGGDKAISTNRGAAVISILDALETEGAYATRTRLSLQPLAHFPTAQAGAGAFASSPTSPSNLYTSADSLPTDSFWPIAIGIMFILLVVVCSIGRLCFCCSYSTNAHSFLRFVQIYVLSILPSLIGA